MRISDWSSDVCSSDLLPVRDSPARGEPSERRFAQIHFHAAGAISTAVQRPVRQNPPAIAAAVPKPRIAHRLLPSAFRPPGLPHTAGCRTEEPFWLGSAMITCIREVRKAKGLTLQDVARSEEHTSELQSLMRNSYAVFC